MQLCEPALIIRGLPSLLLMKVRQTLRPGQRGTQRFTDRYADRLVCVRYRYDAGARRRVTTVELVVDEGAWTPEPALSPETVVGVQVVWGEADLARRVKQVGGRWDARQKVWHLPYRTVQRLRLEERMIRLDGL